MRNDQNWNYKLSLQLQENYQVESEEKIYKVIIETNLAKHDSLASIIEKYHGKVLKEMDFLPYIIVEVPGNAIEELARLRVISKIWSDVKANILLDVAVAAVGGTAAHQLDYRGSGVVIAVIDTGIYPHDDLVKPENRILAWNDMVNDRKDPYDDNGHGTHVAGIIAGNGYSSGQRYTGMVPEAKLVGVKVLDHQGSGSISDVISGVEWCIKSAKTLKIKVINMSLGAPAQESYQADPLCRATSAAWKSGIAVCVAGGNEGPSSGTIGTPGINPAVITVGNIDDQNTINREDDRLHLSSSTGPTVDRLAKPDIVAPGTAITSLINQNNQYQTYTGSSMATGFVSGAVGLLLQKWPNLKPDMIKKMIKKSTKDIGLGQYLQGSGMLDLVKMFGLSPDNSIQSKEKISKVLGYNLLKIATSNTGLKTSQFSKKLDRLIEESIYEYLKKPR